MRRKVYLIVRGRSAVPIHIFHVSLHHLDNARDSLVSTKAEGRDEEAVLELYNSLHRDIKCKLCPYLDIILQ